MSNILVVEDSVMDRKLICLFLKNAGHFVMEATNGKEALEKKLPAIPDLLIVDWVMKEMDGIELLEIIKSEFTTQTIRAIMVSAHNKLDDVVEGLDSGADDYICKPFDKRIFLAKVRAQLRIKLLIDRLIRENLSFKGLKKEATIIPQAIKPDLKVRDKNVATKTEEICLEPERFKKIAAKGITKILFVCKANLFRSPVAEKMFTRKLRKLNRNDIFSESAGLITKPPNKTLNVNVADILSKLYIDLSKHYSRTINNTLAEISDLILVMEKEQEDELARLYPAEKDKIFLLSGFMTGKNRGSDIADPFSKDASVSAFRFCCYNISSSVDGLVELLVNYAES